MSILGSLRQFRSTKEPKMFGALPPNPQINFVKSLSFSKSTYKI